MDPRKMQARARERLTPRRWYSFKASDATATVLEIFDEIWDGGTSAESFARDLARVDTPELEVQINSPGGDVFAGIGIFNLLRAHPAYVTAKVVGVAASIASVILQAGDRRVMLSGSQTMIHQAWGLAVGPADDMRSMADLLDKQDTVIAGIYAERSGRTAAHFRSLMAAESWFDATETVREGLADEVLSPARKTATSDVLNEYARFVALTNNQRR